MICDFCTVKTKPRRVKKHHTYKGRLYVVEHVTAEVCRECGERCYHATTLDALDRLLDAKHPVKETLEVEVISL